MPSLRKLSRRKRIAFAALAVVGGLAVLELGTRIVAYATTGKWSPSDFWWGPRKGGDLYERHPYLGRVPVAGFAFEVDGHQVSVNASGYRGREVAVPKPEGVFRVVALGGSSTFGTGASSDATTWPARLEARLSEAHPDRTWEVVNAGIAGSASSHSLIQLALRMVDLEPDCVIVYQAANDVARGAYPGFRSDYGHFDGRRDAELAARGPLDRAWGFLRDHSLLCGKIGHRLNAPSSVEASGTAADAARVYGRNLRSIVGIARAHGADAILCSQALWRDPPESAARARQYYLPPEALRSAFESYAAAARESAGAAGARFVDVDGELPRETGLFVDPVHLTDAGHDGVAALLAPVVADVERARRGPR